MSKLQDRIIEIEKKQNAILNKSGESLTSEDQAVYDTLDNEAKSLRSIQSDMVLPRQTEPSPLSGFGSVRVVPKKLQCFSSEQTALGFGNFIRGISAGMVQGDNARGGFLVPDEFSGDLIRLVEERGVFRRECRTIQMSSESLMIPRQVGSSTAFYVGESDQITSSDLTLDQVQLNLKKVACLSSFSSELSNDAIISVADMLAVDFAHKLADAEDEAGFNGDGSSVYGGVTGVRQSLLDNALGGDPTGAVGESGLVRSSVAGYAGIALGDLHAVIGKLPMFAEANAKWYMSKFVWSYILDMLADAGGNTIGIIQQGADNRGFLGYPVVISQVMPKQTATNQICILFGDLRQAASMGLSREGLRIESSNSAIIGGTSMFETDQIAIRGIERFDINVHDVGSSTVPGAICGLITHTA